MYSRQINYSPYVDFSPHKTFKEWCRNRFEDCFYNFSDNPYYNNNVCFTNAKILDKFNGKKILIIGGGPSTLKFDFEQTKEYDSCWSMNQFYKNETLSKIHLDLIALSPEVSFDSVGLNNYIKEHNPIIGFEPRYRWTIPFHKFTCNSFVEGKDCFAFMTFFGGKIGVASRMINLAAELGAESVSFIGLDGIPKIFDKIHAFEKGKAIPPAGVSEANAHEVCKHHYDLFWNKMKKDYPNTNFISLQDKNEFHDPHLK